MTQFHPVHSLGFFTIASYERAFGQKTTKEDLIALNSLHIAGYIPIIGIVPAILRFSNTKNCENKNYHYGQIGRGVVECLGGGVLFLIIDIITTIGRHASCFQPTAGYAPLKQVDTPDESKA